MVKGKLIIQNRRDILRSSMIVIVDLSKIESIIYAGNSMKLTTVSGKDYEYSNLSAEEISAVSEFVTSLATAPVDANICKTIVIS